MAISSGYSAEDLAKLGPDALTRKRMLAEALLAKSGGQRKIEHPLQGAAQMAEALVNGLRVRKLDQAETAGMKSGESAWEGLFGGSSSSPQAAMPSTTGAGEQMAATSPAPSTVDISGDKETFVSSLLPAAIEESKRTGVDPRIIVAQAAQETGWGKSAPGNNYFGIKSHGQGGGQTLATNEVIDGKTVRINDSFRQFANPQDSVKGYGDFILQNPRYRGMREAKGLDAQLEALGASGYATDPNYANSVGSIARGIKLPNEVASIDPAAGIPQGAPPQIPPAAAAYVDPMVSAPNAQPQQTAAIPPAGGLPPLAPPREVGTPPVPPNATPPQQMAQALTGAPPQRRGPSVQDLAKILENPWVSDDKKRFAQILLGKQLEQDDPRRQLQMQKLQKEIQGRENQPLINAGDGRLYDPNNRSWIEAPNSNPKAPTVVELFDEATGQPYKATWDAAKGQYERVGGIKARTGMQLTTNPDGTVSLTEGSIGNMPKLTESEGRNSGFYGRGVESHAVLNNLEQEGTSIWNKTVGSLPLVGNFARSEDAQKYDQAKRNFINSVLRRESGAVISPEEFSNADQQYFPQPGDGPEVIEQKRKNRETTIQGLKISSGQGAAFATPPEVATPEKKRLRFNPKTGELE
jgi:flagellum-specific peptidoglycan hydrolase FlgJ